MPALSAAAIEAVLWTTETRESYGRATRRIVRTGGATTSWGAQLRLDGSLTLSPLAALDEGFRYAARSRAAACGRQVTISRVRRRTPGRRCLGVIARVPKGEARGELHVANATVSLWIARIIPCAVSGVWAGVGTPMLLLTRSTLVIPATQPEHLGHASLIRGGRRGVPARTAITTRCELVQVRSGLRMGMSLTTGPRCRTDA